MSEVSEEVACLEFDRFCSFFYIQNDLKRYKEDDLKEFEELKQEIVDSIMDGALVVDDKGKPTYKALSGDEFTMRRPLGKDFMDMDKYPESQSMHKTFSMAASLCGVQPKSITKLDGSDAMFLLKVTGFLISSRKSRSYTPAPS